MKKKLILLLAISSLAVHLASAKRTAPPEVEPVIYEGVRYEAPNAFGKMGIVEAYDTNSGQKLWEKKLYEVKYDPALEGDVQDAWIKEMKIDHDKIKIWLVVIDELDRKYKFIIWELPPIQEIPISFDVDDQGGKYFLMFNNMMGEFVRFPQLLRYFERPEVQKVILIAQTKLPYPPVFKQERLEIIKAAAKGKKLLEIINDCSVYKDCQKYNGKSSDIYDYQDKEVTLKTLKGKYAVGEKVPYTLINRAAYAKHFQVISAEKLIDDVWQEVMWNVPCTDCNPCTFLGQVESGGQGTWEWDQTVWADGCAQAGPGKYRFVVKNMYGYPDESGCRSYRTTVYSNVFEIGN